MCSIAGSHDEKEVWRMLEIQQHRSPDGMNVRSGDFCIGMGRLAIIDTENDEFPMTRDGLTLTFNGEIYNYMDLRRELERIGHTFTTNTDTEVLLRAYHEWGEGCLDRLNGMFAFAVLHPDGSVFAARDIAGEKPFYFTTEPFRFASEAKALGFDCRELPRAHKLWHQGGHTIVNEWFTPQRVYVPPKLGDAVNALSVLLEDSVRLRTRSDVPYGIYLSDGIDSTLLSTYHWFSDTFTYRDDKHDGARFRDLLPRIVWHLDYPVHSFSAYGLWTLAEQARDTGVKVVISGEGADELFGGYVRYVKNEFNRKAASQFPSYKRLFPHEHDILLDEFNGNMQELLRMSDRMASAHGVENRCPYLDRRIIEFAWSLPMEWKIDGMTTKVILRELLARRLPSYEVGEKHGLYCSVNEWLGEKDPLDKKEYLSLQNALWKKFL